MEHMQAFHNTYHAYSAPEGDATKLKVFYETGGAASDGARPEQRGIYVSLQPIRRGGPWETYDPADGASARVRPLSRLSRKQLREVAEQVDPLVEELFRACDAEGIGAAMEYLRTQDPFAPLPQPPRHST